MLTPFNLAFIKSQESNSHLKKTEMSEKSVHLNMHLTNFRFDNSLILIITCEKSSSK